MDSYKYSILFLFTGIVDVFLSVILFLMLVRVILSWLPLSDGNVIEEYIFAVTEPFIIPIRLIIDRIDALNGFPIDISFFISYILLSILHEALSGFTI